MLNATITPPLDPMLATPGPLPIGPRWSYEVKWDGIRLLADITGKGLRLSSRTGRDMTRHFPELADLAGIGDGVALDGEVVMLVDGMPSLLAVSERVFRAPTLEQVRRRPVVLMLFDLVRLNEVSSMGRPLDERRTALRELNLADVSNVQVCPVFDDGPRLSEVTRETGLEGVVAKRRDSRYRPGKRSSDWVKVVHHRANTGWLGASKRSPAVRRCST